MDDRLAPHTARNFRPIAEVLRTEFSDRSDVLEIGSGSGQHATLLATRLRHLCWQTSDLEENHAAINAWLAEAKLPNVLPPLAVDTMTAVLPGASYDAVFSANTAHIMSMTAVEKMFSLVARVLRSDGIFCLYGPFRQAGMFSSDSNAQFDASLRSRDASMGIRDLEDLDSFAAAGGLQRLRCYSMPANNLLLVWSRRGAVS
jgi:cyclopropane fatty-acyl-phospholipid synthase-like methyltransferase